MCVYIYTYIFIYIYAYVYIKNFGTIRNRITVEKSLYIIRFTDGFVITLVLCLWSVCYATCYDMKCILKHNQSFIL